MSLYHEAASVLNSSNEEQISIRSTVFAKKNWKSPLPVLLALASETAKWSSVLSEVIELSNLLKNERQLLPALALVLVHDLLLSKKGIALPSSHGLVTSVQRNKARLQAEFTKARIRRSCATIDQLKAKVEREAVQVADGEHDIDRHPRWVRVNTLLSTKEAELSTTFAAYKRVATISEILRAEEGAKVIHHDANVPNLLALPANTNLTSTKAYRSGSIILQDKASCFPACLIDPRSSDGDVLDACAAPGNKTTHLAAILHDSAVGTTLDGSKIIACEKDTARSQILARMVQTAGADRIVDIKQQQDFLKLDPAAGEFRNVTKLLLDPSCSGSGIVNRDRSLFTIRLPSVKTQEISQGRKRKRDIADENVILEEQPVLENDKEKLQARLDNLAEFQLRLVCHAMSFPAATQISYSTCSVHGTENEEVVMRALISDIAIARGWTIQRRDQQVPGIRDWYLRGDANVVKAFSGREDGAKKLNQQDIVQGCVRCDKRGSHGTMGFFVAGFLRGSVDNNACPIEILHDLNDVGEQDDWDGFDDA